MRSFLIAAFYLIMTPVALVTRVVLRRDPLQRTFDSRAMTYRQRCQPRDAYSLFRQR